MRVRAATQGFLVACALAALLVLAAPASAHASLVSSEPTDLSQLDAAPTQVRIVLSEGIEPSGSSMKVLLAANGTTRQVDDGHLDIQDPDGRPILTIGLQPDLPAGIYTATWKVLSKDTHTVEQSI